MPEKMSVLKLPIHVRSELEQRLAENGYSGYVALEEWLAGLGYVVGKSSLHRYGTRLRAYDAKQGKLVAGVLEERTPAREQRARDTILRELGLLRVREKNLMDQLVELGRENREDTK